MGRLSGIEWLQTEFNQWSGTSRLLAVLSPTCPHCLAGYELILRMPEGPLCMVMWTAMLEGDSPRAASALITSDRRCVHYWEDEGWPISTRFRPVLGFGPYDPGRSVMDVYLLYHPGVVWHGDDPPLPSDWAHNLQEEEPQRPRITPDVLAEWAR